MPLLYQPFGVDTILQMRAILLFSLILTQPVFAGSVGTVIYIDGQASALRKGGEAKLQQGSQIYINDRIRTTQLGKLRVIIGEQCSIMIYGNTELRIENEIKDSKTPYIQATLSPIVK